MQEVRERLFREKDVVDPRHHVLEHLRGCIDALNEQQKAGILSTIPTGRLGAGADVAAAVAFLASDEAGYVTGQTLHVNGGMVMI